MTATFIVGNTYESRFIGSSEVRMPYIVEKMTDKTITVRSILEGYTVRRNIRGGTVRLGDGEYLHAEDSA